MCDYSTEHLHSVPARAGERYKFDLRIVHGFIPAGYGTSDIGLYLPPTVVCVRPGQTLALSNLTTGSGLLCTCRDCMCEATRKARELSAYPTSATVTVVSKRDDPVRYDHFGLFNDGIQFDDGRSLPLADIYYADMMVVPVQPTLPAPRAVDLKKFFTLPKAPARARQPVRVTELADAD